jgi:hypothetical protein
MPLQVSITDSSGVTSTYWTINHIQADMTAQTASASLAGYLDATAFSTGKSASARRPYFFSVPFSAIPSVATGSISMAEMYTAILNQINDPKRATPSPLAGATLVA